MLSVSNERRYFIWIEQNTDYNFESGKQQFEPHSPNGFGYLLLFFKLTTFELIMHSNIDLKANFQTESITSNYPFLRVNRVRIKCDTFRISVIRDNL